MTKSLRRLEPTEHQIVSAVMDYARFTIVRVPHKISYDYSIATSPIEFEYMAMPLINFFVKITNEGKRSFGHAKYLKEEGLNKGVSDSFLAYPIPQRRKIGMWMEAKSKKGKLTKEQEYWIRFMRFVGFDAVVYRTVDEGIQAIKEYLGIKR